MNLSHGMLIATCFSSVACADWLETLPTPLSEHTLSETRGGFHLNNDYVVNIGLSFTTSLNGEDVFNSTIADLTFVNGILSAVPDPMGSLGQLNILQVGNGNISSNDLISDPSSINDANLIQSAINNNTLINVIQNSVDGSVIGLGTLIEIEADVGGLLKQIQGNRQLQESILLQNQ